jgi:hypothetical protein
MFIQPHNEAGYTSAVVTDDPDPADLLQSGGVHIRPHMRRSDRHSLAGCSSDGLEYTGTVPISRP